MWKKKLQSYTKNLFNIKSRELIPVKAFLSFLESLYICHVHRKITRSNISSLFLSVTHTHTHTRVRTVSVTQRYFARTIKRYLSLGIPSLRKFHSFTRNPKDYEDVTQSITFERDRACRRNCEAHFVEYSKYF